MQSCVHHNSLITYRIGMGLGRVCVTFKVQLSKVNVGFQLRILSILNANY